MAELKTAKKERSTGRERIKELEDEIKNTQYNKATQHHVGLIKAKIAILKGRAEAAKTKKGAAHGRTATRTARL